MGALEDFIKMTIREAYRRPSVHRTNNLQGVLDSGEIASGLTLKDSKVSPLELRNLQQADPRFIDELPVYSSIAGLDTQISGHKRIGGNMSELYGEPFFMLSPKLKKRSTFLPYAPEDDKEPFELYKKALPFTTQKNTIDQVLGSKLLSSPYRSLFNAYRESGDGLTVDSEIPIRRAIGMYSDDEGLISLLQNVVEARKQRFDFDRFEDTKAPVLDRLMSEGMSYDEAEDFIERVFKSVKKFSSGPKSIDDFGTIIEQHTRGPISLEEVLGLAVPHEQLPSVQRKVPKSMPTFSLDSGALEEFMKEKGYRRGGAVHGVR